MEGGWGGGGFMGRKVSENNYVGGREREGGRGVHGKKG